MKKSSQVPTSSLSTGVSRVTLRRHRGCVLLMAFAAIAEVAACGSGASVAVMAGNPDGGVPPEGGAAARAGELTIPEPPPAITPAECAATRPLPSGPEELVFADEFEGDRVDPTKWFIREGYKGHGTIQNTAQKKNLRVHDGVLEIAIRAEPGDRDHPFSSGHIDTVGRFAHRFGRVEMRARFAATPGTWYAMWARPWDGLYPEIDVELLGKEAEKVWFVNHWAAPPMPADERRKFFVVEGVDITQFHIYTVEWSSEALEWKLDGKPYMRSIDQGVPRGPVTWTINGWVGGWGGAADPAAFPVTFEVDYFRIYRKTGERGSAALRIGNERGAYSKAAETVRVEVADFDAPCLQVAMYDGDVRVMTMTTTPFDFPLTRVARGRHVLRFVADDGVRSAERTIDVDVR